MRIRLTPMLLIAAGVVACASSLKNVGDACFGGDSASCQKYERGCTEALDSPNDDSNDRSTKLAGCARASQQFFNDRARLASSSVELRARAASTLAEICKRGNGTGRRRKQPVYYCGWLFTAAQSSALSLDETTQYLTMACDGGWAEACIALGQIDQRRVVDDDYRFLTPLLASKGTEDLPKALAHYTKACDLGTHGHQAFYDEATKTYDRQWSNGAAGCRAAATLLKARGNPGDSELAATLEKKADGLDKLEERGHARDERNAERAAEMRAASEEADRAAAQATRDTLQQSTTEASESLRTGGGWRSGTPSGGGPTSPPVTTPPSSRGAHPASTANDTHKAPAPGAPVPAPQTPSPKCVATLARGCNANTMGCCEASMSAGPAGPTCENDMCCAGLSMKCTTDSQCCSTQYPRRIVCGAYASGGGARCCLPPGTPCAGHCEWCCGGNDTEKHNGDSTMASCL